MRLRTRSKMTAQIFRRSERAPLILLRLEQNNINLRNEQENEHNRRAEASAQTQRDHFKITAKVERYERDPDHARRVHTKADEFGLVEILRQISSLDGVQRAKYY